MKGPSTIGVNLRVTGHCNQGGRKYMEDVFCVAYQQTEDDKDLEYAFFGIFDGHGGGEAAAYAKEHLMDNIVNQKNFWSEDDSVVLKAIKDGFISTHHGMWNELPNWPKTASGLPSTSGTTASIAFIRKGKMYIGHVGDSGIVLGYEEEGSPPDSRWAARQLTNDHKPTTPAEKDRIEQSGGKVKYKSGVLRVVWNRPRLGHKGPVRRSTRIDEIPFLAVARSLGDLWSYNSESDEFVVSPEPDVYVIPIDIKKHRVLIFGTDGLWNMVTPWAAVHSAQQTESHNEAQIIAKATNANSPSLPWLNPSKRLVDSALERWYELNLRADNVSAVTVMLDPPCPPKSEVILRQCQIKRKKFRAPDRMSVHSNVYDSKGATVPVRVPLFTKQSTCGNGEGLPRRSADGAPKPIVFRPRNSPENAERRQDGQKDVVQSPEVSSSIDDTSLSPGKLAAKAKEVHGPPKGKIHRVSGSLFVQNQEPPRPPPDVIGNMLAARDRRPLGVGTSMLPAAPWPPTTLMNPFGSPRVVGTLPGAVTTQIVRQVTGPSNPPVHPPIRDMPPVPPNTPDSIDTLSRIVDRMWVAPPQEPPKPPKPLPVVAPAVTTTTPKPVESRVLRSTHHTGLPASVKSVEKKQRKSKVQAPTPTPKAPPRTGRALRSATKPMSTRSACKVRQSKETVRVSLKRKRTSSPTKPGKTPAKKTRVSLRK